MPIYDYKCRDCSKEFNVTKSMSSIDDLEACPSCKFNCDKTCRLITTAKEFFGEKPDEPFFAHALGKMVKGKNDLRRQAKARGLIEVGNEDVGKLIDRSDREREKKANDRWSEFTNPTPYQVRG